MGKKNRSITKPRALKPLAQQILESNSNKFVKKTLAKKLSKRDKKTLSKEARKKSVNEKKTLSGQNREAKRDERMRVKMANLASEQIMEDENGSIYSPRKTYAGSMNNDLEDSFSEVSLDNGAGNESLVDELEISATDQEAIDFFMKNKTSCGVTFNLAEAVEQQLREKEAERKKEFDGPGSQLNPKVVEVYEAVGVLMTRYRSGKVPKALKVIPQLSNWEEILFIARVEDFSPQSVFVLTRLFTSNVGEKAAQRYFSNILYPRIREDIHENKKLNFHLYNALKKALFKPAAFFKGIVVPAILDQTTTAREAVVMASILQNRSIPMLHSAAAMIKITQVMSIQNFGPGLIFLKVLVNKKYSLPLKVIDALAKYFGKFVKLDPNDSGTLPVIWHQTLLAFVQRYKLNLSQDNRKCIKSVIKIHSHHQITEEIRRELSVAGNANSARMET
eukprot:maker-scaffold_34-snap-gene-0.4-mRNA-1 protein AED:0.02 eAED:0.02 QI:89/1/1/1/1/1/2/196/447